MRMSELFTPLINIEEGWHDRNDPTKDVGFAIMENAIITDRGGAAVRPGTELFGAADTTNGAINSLFTAKMRNGTNVMVRSSDTLLQYYNRLASAFALLRSSFTNALEFGFVDHNRGKVSGSIDNNQYTYLCNGIEPFMRWRNEGWEATNLILAGGELFVQVNSTLDSTVFFTGTASAVTGTTLNIASAEWANNIWNNFYVRITSGAQSGTVSLISGTTSTQITFAAIAGLAGTPTFEIRLLKFPASGTIKVNTTNLAYSAIATDNRFTVASAPVAAVNSPVTLVPEELPGNPRGNLFTTLFTQLFLSGNRRFPTTVYRAKIDDAADFTFSAPRTAGQGDVIDIPMAVPKITDINTFEDKLIVGSESYVEQITFTQDANDLPSRVPLMQSSLRGPAGHMERMGDDLVFANKNKQITSLSRIAYKDQRPLVTDIAWPIKRSIRNFDFSVSKDKTYKNFTMIACKQSSASVTNDLVLVYDNNRQKWIGKWSLPANVFTEYDGNLYMGSAASREVYKMLTNETVQRKGDATTGYKMRCATQWVNQSPDLAHEQRFTKLLVEGYIKLNTNPTFRLYYDFAKEAEQSWVFHPSSHTKTILGVTAEETMGETPLGVTPLGVEVFDEDVGDFGEFRFIAYFRVPERVHNYCRFEFETDGANQYLEVTGIKNNVTFLDVIREDYIIDTENA